MIKEIKYNGFTATPSDYECPDGDLATIEGLVPEDEALRPILTPTDLFTLPDGYRVAFIHKMVPQITKYIIVNDTDNYDNYIYYRGDGQEDTLTGRLVGFVPVSVNAVGNTLIVFGEYQMCYLLWANNTYKVLGSQLPRIALSFGLQGHPHRFSNSDDSHSEFTINFDGMSEEQMRSEFNETNKIKITEQIMAKVNKFVADQSSKKGRFCFPFFVRYALRLYDGSLSMHSAPVLMNPCTTNNPIVYWTNAQGSGTVSSATCDMMLVACDLDYQFLSVKSDDFAQWKDIVKSVDVFISKPIYPYDQNGYIKSCVETNDFDSVFVGKLFYNGSTRPEDDIEEDKYILPINDRTNPFDLYAQWTFSKLYAMYFSPSRLVPGECFRLPEFSEGKMEESLINTATFYKLCSINLDSLSEASQTRAVINIDDDYLQSLVNREVMTDDYLSHDKLTAKLSYAYNSRLNLSGIKRRIFNGFSMNEMLAFCNGRYNFSKVQGSDKLIIEPASGMSDKYTVLVNLKENGEEKTVICNGDYLDNMQDFLSDQHTTMNPVTGVSVTEMSKESWGCFFFYPNANAYKMTIVHDGNNFTHGGHKYEIQLLPHEYLNGAFALLSYNIERNSMGNYSGSSDENDEYVNLPNKIYTSEVNNPFYFPALGINTIGTGTILGISSAVKALSQGQFGQFPLYAFTDEGVWALEVSSAGTFSARQPVSRDVVIGDGNSITQIDSAVLFATKRGIMLISGSSTSCISDTVNSDSPFNINALYGLNGSGSSHDRFLDYINNCRMLYDYTHQRIIVYNPGKTYAYIYSLKSKMWSTMPSTIKDSLNSYPDALAQIQIVVPPAQEGDSPTTQIKVINYSEDNPSVTTGFNGVLVTRPLKLDMPDVLKTIYTVIQRGHFRKGHVKTILYGSRDLFNWHPIYSSIDHYLRGFRGTPYKYFRIALLCTLDKDESIYGCTVQYTPRLINQPR